MNSKSNEGRRKALEMVFQAQKSHIGSDLSVMDILAVLLEKVSKSDETIMGKGWCSAAFYWYLSELGTIPKADLERFCAEGEKDYIGLLEPSVNGVQLATGSVGLGLPFGVGRCLAKRLKKETGHVYVIEGDGAIQCGTFWESAMIAAHHGLDNLTLLVDANGLQAMGKTSDILDYGNLCAKLGAFGWQTHRVDGHDHALIREALDFPSTRPKAIICDTVKGKGVSTMENRTEWHYKAPNREEFEAAMKELTQ